MPAVATLWPWALALVLTMAVVIVILLVLVLKKSAKKQVIRVGEPEEEDEPAAAPKAADDEQVDTGIASAFRRAREEMMDACDGNPYGHPFYLVVGPDKSHEPGFLTGAAGNSLHLETDEPLEAGLGFGNGSQFLFYNEGALLDVGGDAMLADSGVSADDREWKQILRHLTELRPKRPLDGVVLTYSASELLASTRDEVERLKLTSRADRLQRKLWDLQRELGFRMPVYVLITGSERLEGFSAMCSAVPPVAREELLGQILGWSSPYATQAAFRADWVDEAFEVMHGDLIDAQMKLFAERPQSSGLLFFPYSLRALQPAVRTLLNQLFKGSAYHDGAIFRGFYFCGSDRGTTAFVDDLVLTKIFKEVGLAIPTSRTRMVRNRQVRALQLGTAAAALFFVGGLSWAAWNFKQQKALVKPLLEDSISALSIAPVAEDKVTAAEAGKVLEAMARIRFGHYGSVYVPSSWFSSFNDDLQLALQHTFAQVVLTSIADRLEDKVSYAIDTATLRIDPVAAPVQPQRAMSWGTYADPTMEPIVAIEQTEEFRRLRTYMNDLGQIEAKARMLRDLATPKRGDLKMLGELVEYSFGQKLSRDFYRRGGFYENALRATGVPGAQTFNADKFRPQTSETAQQLANAFYDRIFTRNGFPVRLRALKSDLDMAEVNRSYDVTRFRDLVRDIDRVQTDLTRPQLQWAFRPTFDLGPEFSHLLTAIDRSELVDDTAALNIRARGSADWANFRTALTERARLTGTILAVKDGIPERRLSSDTVLLQSALQAFLDQSFVSAPVRETTIASELPPQTRLVWNMRVLERSADAYGAYERFRERGLKMFAPELWASVDDAARARVRAQMVDYLVEAQMLQPAPPPLTPAMLEEEIRTGVAHFASAQPLVEHDVAIFTQLGLEDVKKQLSAIQSAEALRLLRLLDELLDREAPYTPRENNFNWWDGKTPASPAAWDAKDPAEVAAYLDATRANIARLTRSYATPLLKWFKDASHGGEGVVIDKWQSIVDDLRDAEEKKPGNAPMMLDEYIASHMMKVTVNDCQSAQLTARPARIRGYFASRMLQLSDALQERCSIAATDVALERYAELASYFNRRLAGRYPFAEQLPRARDVEADPEDIRYFFALYDRNAALFRSLDTRGAYGARLRQAQHFIEEMRDVRKFFASFLDVEKPQRTPLFEVEPNFRTLQGLEYGANEIIQWSLTIGDKTLTERDKGKKLMWSPGMPVRLALRWASDAPRVPVLIGEKRGVSVVDRTITYDYTNRWSLLTTLDDLGAAGDQFRPDVDVPPVTLSLIVNTKLAAGGEPEKQPAQAFMRVTLLNKDAKPLDLPPLFPAKAPGIEQLTAEDLQ
jgi:type VI secretion system protein ImpL